MSLDSKVGSQVTIEGTARNAMAGAIVQMDDRTPVYVDGLERWDGAFSNKKVSVTGTLTKRGADDVVADNGEQASGIGSNHFVLEQPTWALS